MGEDFLGKCRNKQAMHPIELAICRLLIGLNHMGRGKCACQVDLGQDRQCLLAFLKVREEPLFLGLSIVLCFTNFYFLFSPLFYFL